MKVEIDGRTVRASALEARRRVCGSREITGLLPDGASVTLTLTPDEEHGLWEGAGWEAFEAMQHAITDLRRTSNPWPWTA